jgi:hypothetical protein
MRRRFPAARTELWPHTIFYISYFFNTTPAALYALAARVAEATHCQPRAAHLQGTGQARNTAHMSQKRLARSAALCLG